MSGSVEDGSVISVHKTIPGGGRRIFVQFYCFGRKKKIWAKVVRENIFSAVFQVQKWCRFKKNCSMTVENKSVPT
jgi:hypothetical protein